MLTPDGRLMLTPELWAILADVQQDGNKVVWTSDQEVWGEIERWEFPKEIGRKKVEDCDGITLYKMRALINKGIPSRCLNFTACLTEEGEGHAILDVTTDRGDFLLDNRQMDVVAYDELLRQGYKFLYRTQDGRMTGNWVNIV